MKTAIIKKIIAYTNTRNASLKLWYADTRIFKHKVVELDSPEFFDEIHDREHTYHIAYQGKYDCCEDFTMTFNSFWTAYEMFKEMLKRKGFKDVLICEDFEDYNPYKECEEQPQTQEEEYAEACMAEACGEPFLMQRYNRKYHIENDYGPSNPWDAPGMKVSDFI